MWAQLWAAPLPVTSRTVAWRVLHGALMVGALRLRVSQGGQHPMLAADACCAACRAAGRGDHLETLSHAFLDCPDVAPALEWLLGVAGYLFDELVPRDPLVILGAADWVWAPRAGGRPVTNLWSILRIAYLGAVWTVRCAVRALHPGARCICDQVVRTLAQGVQRDWLRTLRDVRQDYGGVVPSVWFRGPAPELTTEAFQALWPNLGPWYRTPPGDGVVDVLLSLDWPGAAPPPPPPPPATPPSPAASPPAADAVAQLE